MLLAAATSGLLIGPGAYHRLRFRSHDLEHTIAIGHRMAIAGLASLVCAIGCSIVLAASMLISHGPAVLLGAVAFAFVSTLWFVLPIARRLRDRT